MDFRLSDFKSSLFKYQYELFAIIGTVIVLWQIFLPGYVLLLDWIGGPNNVVSFNSLLSVVSSPSIWLLYFLKLLMPAWLVQKLIFGGMFFILFYFPLRFFPETQEPVKYINSKVKGHKVFRIERYFASLLFVFNPFVYERVLAGQWRVVVGYAFMFPLMYYIFKFTTEQSWQTVAGIFGTLFITGMWSIHFLAIGIIMVSLYIFIFSLINLWQKRFKLLWFASKKIIIGIVFFGLASCYWIIPYKWHGDTTLEQFGPDHWQAFTTASDKYIGVIGNVITWRGFWGESHIWAHQFNMPWDRPFLFYGTFLVIGYLVVRSIKSIKSVKSKANKINLLFLVVLFILSVVFATGMSAYGFWIINGWLADNLNFWSGFRDAQKWTGVTALIYVILASWGIRGVVTGLKPVITKRFDDIKWAVLFIPILFVPQMLFGFNGQIKTVWYPKSWQEVNQFIKSKTEGQRCKALFLPWHQYYSVKFNNEMLVANPSHRFFDCEVIAGHNTELGNIKSISGGVENYQIIEKFIMSNNSENKFIDQGIKMLQENNIQYIIWTNDLVHSDLYKYPFLKSTKLKKIIDKEDIVLYEIK